MMKTFTTALLFACLLAPSALFAQNPPAVQTFYVPAPEDQALSSLQSIYNGSCGNSPTPGDPVTTFLSIAAVADGTLVYYDHWEDGFEADISNPTQATTELWGDGDASNGSAPGVAGDVIDAGTVIVIFNDVDTSTLPSVIDFDGGDRFGVSKTTAVTRAAWADGPDTLMAGSLVVLDTTNWGTVFQVPVGEDLTNDTDMFQYTGAVIMASEDGTLVEVDIDKDGTIDVSSTLNQERACRSTAASKPAPPSAPQPRSRPTSSRAMSAPPTNRAGSRSIPPPCGATPT